MKFELDFNITLSEELDFKKEPVKGEFITIDGFEEFKFFICYSFDDKDEDLKDKHYTICEYQTGTLIAKGKKIIDTLSQAEKLLNDYGVEALRKRIKSRLQILRTPANA